MKKNSTSATSIEDTPITPGDVESGRLVRRERGANGRLSPREKRVPVPLDESIIAHFKLKAGDEGYEALINKTLRENLVRNR